MNDRLRSFLFNGCLGVPGSLLQIVAWFFLISAMGEVSSRGSALDLLSALAVPVVLAAFLIGRLMVLARDLLTGALRVPQNKRAWILSLINPIAVWIFLAGIISQVVVLCSSFAKDNHAASFRSGATLLAFMAASIAVQISDDRLQKRIRQEWKEQWTGRPDKEGS